MTNVQYTTLPWGLTGHVQPDGRHVFRAPTAFSLFVRGHDGSTRKIGSTPTGDEWATEPVDTRAIERIEPQAPPDTAVLSPEHYQHLRRTPMPAKPFDVRRGNRAQRRAADKRTLQWR